MDHDEKYILTLERVFLIIIIPILANLIVIDFVQAKSSFAKQPDHVINQSIITNPLTGSATPPVVTLLPSNATPTITFSPSPAVKVIPPQVHEYFVPLGTGSSSAADWTDVQGLSATIDTGYYGFHRDVVFEATLHIPTGNESASVRLYNATDQHPVWFSEISTEGGIGTLLTSQPITLDEGKKVYQVQMKTSLQFAAILDQARVHIVVY